MEVSLNHPASNTTSTKNNNSAFFYFESCQPPSPALLLLCIAYTVVLIVGLFGNLSLIIIIFKKQRKAQNFTSILIANLSLSDTLVCVMCIHFTIIYTLMDHWIFGDTMCRLTSYVQSVSISVSIFSLVFTAVERYQLIVNPRGCFPFCCLFPSSCPTTSLMSPSATSLSPLTSTPTRWPVWRTGPPKRTGCSSPPPFFCCSILFL
uniref:cDNA FLJ52676, moderately similar to Neuropeptide Y receptor type 6 n=1 Tax=Homo sapiens TaxID=9606 RepID=B4DRU5_HUMAN|nr:unnamed protein product [Homo sapiens]